MNLAPIYDTYRQYCDMRVVYGKSMVTTSTLRSFISWININYSGEMMLTQDMLDAWCMKRQTEKWNSYVQRIGALKDYLTFLRGKGYDEYIIETKRKIKEYPIFHPLSQPEINNFFRAADDISNEIIQVAQEMKEGPRKKGKIIKAYIMPVCVRFLYSSGVRPNEIRLLQTRSIDLNTGIISISSDETKGYRERLIVLDDGILGLFKSYHTEMERMVPGHRIFFCNSAGNYYSPWWWETLFRECWDLYNKKHTVVAYAFRHNYVIENISKLTQKENSRQLLAISASLGHSTVRQTLYYSHMTTRLSKTIEKADPEFLTSIFDEIDNE